MDNPELLEALASLELQVLLVRLVLRGLVVYWELQELSARLVWQGQLAFLVQQVPLARQVREGQMGLLGYKGLRDHQEAMVRLVYRAWLVHLVLQAIQVQLAPLDHQAVLVSLDLLAQVGNREALDLQDLLVPSDKQDPLDQSEQPVTSFDY